MPLLGLGGSMRRGYCNNVEMPRHVWGAKARLDDGAFGCRPGRKVVCSERVEAVRAGDGSEELPPAVGSPSRTRDGRITQR